MGTPDNKISDFVDIVKSWIPRRSESTNVSRDFWMPDHSCRVCYECDSQFTVFNRRHHCRLCGRVFCAKCTASSIPAPSDDPRNGGEDWERIRVCNYCFKQWQHGTAAPDNGTNMGSPVLSPSPSATSLVSTKSSCTCNSSDSTVGSTPYSTGAYQRVPYSSALSPQQSAQMDPTAIEQENATCGRSTDTTAAALHSSADKLGYCMNRSDDEDDVYGLYRSVSGTKHFSHADVYYGPVTFDEIEHMYGPHEMINGGDQIDATGTCSLPSPENFYTQGVDKIKNDGEEAYGHEDDECESPVYDVDAADAEPVDFENNGLLWLPPEPEDEEDEREAVLFDDDEDDEAATGEWGYLRPSNSFGNGEYRCKDKSSEDHRKAMKNVVEGHFRALVAQLLQVENLTVGDEDDKESWLEIITSLSWEAATLLKPDTSKGGGMDPGGYVKVKCIACGHRSESMVVKGVVCKKNVAHRRMMSKIDKPRFLILGGALEYQRVSNHLSSVDTLLQQEMDHLKMAVTKIDAHHPNVLLVEKSVSRYAQEYLLAKDISLVLNIKKSLLERIARCTGAHIVPSIDHLNSQKLGYCDLFHVEKFLEEHGSAGQGGKKLTKTLMFFEGCPKPLGYTILLRGAHGDELKKVKHVVQYGVFAAYHLALETSFLADEGASLPQLPLTSSIAVALPDKPSSIDRSISTIPGFSVQGTGKPSGFEPTNEVQKSNAGVISEMASPTNFEPACNSGGADDSTCLSKTPSSETECRNTASKTTENTGFLTLSSLGHNILGPCHNNLSSDDVFRKDVKMEAANSCQSKKTNTEKAGFNDPLVHRSVGTSMELEEGANSSHPDGKDLAAKQVDNSLEEIGSSKEEFPPSPSDHQSILVSLSTRCVWKGTVCERAHLFRIKYYGSFDKPLGRFLRDHLFDQNYRCCSCEMPSEAHVYCYTHRQGSLTISVKKLPEFLLPGEREGKIWMWHRCLRCPRINGFPPATRRVVMSDAAWGLSFGKFLELSFSNHAAASRVASCGHSLQRDCLRFYGFGRMVACFRYASIHVYSVSLPPSKIKFNYDDQEWIQNEANEVHQRAELLFKEVQNALQRISEKILGAGSQNGDLKASELSRLRIAELEGMLQKEKEQFEDSFWDVLSKDMKNGQPVVDILDINKLQRQILFHSYVWDQLLINAGSLRNISPQESPKSFVPKVKEKSVNSVEDLVEMDIPLKPNKDTKSEVHPIRGGNDSNNSQLVRVHETKNLVVDLNLRKEAERSLSSSANINEKNDPHESGKVVRRAFSEGEFPVMDNLSDTLDAAWTGKNHLVNMVRKENVLSSPDPTALNTVHANSGLENCVADKGGIEKAHLPGSALTAKTKKVENSSLAGMSFPNIHSSFKWTSSLNVQKLNISEHNPVYVLLFRELERQSGARLLLPVSINDTIIPVYDDEPTSIIAYALYSSDYRQLMSECEKPRDIGDSTSSSLPLFDSVNLLSFNSFDESASDIYRSLGSIEESILSIPGSRGSQVLDPLLYTKDLHARVSFTDDSLQGKVKYVVTCYYAKRFEALRKISCPSELDFIRSLSRCKKWGAQGGKSNVFFAKTLDDRFIIKQVTKTELESFIKFGPAYFKYLSDSISTGSPTCLAKILGIYQVSSKHLKGGKESKMDVLVMENLLFRRNVVRLYDLKGSSRSRYNADTSGSNKVLLDQNLIETMPTSPIFVGNKAKRLLERAVWNDTSFLASVDVMDYSLLVGVDEKRHELVVGIIDFMRQYTWDKHLETWVKASGILGGSKNTTPTVISPQQYKKRFRKAMTAYFLMVPDQWSPPTIIPNGSQSDLCEENLQGGASVD
ncbi:1-phosphatidylinositol-3-phosphate 5-kinase FAB1A isoform X1 [Ricinus communis]|uniref:1-phosphatidylinositol-3-phosphate 5-kinase FAB1A isoform X1 n=1 Tax=Ricinus communis TaxID=3988 RepID=UPI00201B1902|nr:1-phosphatidylinositol-3-phosphate 5-kinase FAB1A isoform X1 [Ricinus communis]XP_025012599.2 1-phosphatidylinositol-3-phosphate 5-kinase FAB1A isoform X1 [Ricinus communis]XP_025012600.2 1-phosphatidylinositol-3-phosphate 5-kinase FAB1A isoform X1 [Ricinus communis]XP_048227865.1 1-phosphatidylinositol-3-phosphate 5-kinase FAB1A isoform X1 [Ricinus communis]XP_048227866.1 1-phosphatidylinositol-3-phosphate 5-kinase FAB1A isoform X1 [Ricinus communis]XP_048227867.1 1-phosphatidylinositol-3-